MNDIASNIQRKHEKLKRLYEQESASQHPARTQDDIPFSYELITAEWLTATLCRDHPGAKVESFKLDVVDNGTSNRRRIAVQYNAVGQQLGLPQNLFCKATQTLESRYVLGLVNMVEAEVTFYREIKPLLDIEAPRCLFANIDLDSLNSIIVLEDLTGRVQFLKHDSPITLEQAKGQMTTLAKLHSRFYQAPELNTVAADYLDITTYIDMINVAIQWSKTCQRGFVVARDVIPERLFKREAEIWPASEKVFAQHDKLPTTLLHNDVHLKNWYAVDAHTMGLGDYQCVVKGHWSRDLAYAIATGLPTDKRREWEKPLIEHYLQEMAARGVTETSLEEAFVLYRQQLFVALAWWTGTLVHSDEAPEMQPVETSMEFIGRIARAIDDLDALGATQHL